MIDWNSILAEMAHDAPGVLGVVIIVIAVLRYLDIWNKEWRKWMEKQQKDNQQFMSYMEEHITTNQKSILAILQKVDLGVENLHSFFTSHDDWERKTLAARVRRVKRKPKP